MKKINEEVDRILEMMNIKESLIEKVKELILESIGSETVTLIDDVIEALTTKSKEVGRHGNQEILGIEFKSQSAVDDLVDALKRAKSVGPNGQIAGLGALDDTQEMLFYGILKNMTVGTEKNTVSLVDRTYQKFLNSYREKILQKPQFTDSQAEFEFLRDVYDGLKTRFPNKDSFTKQEVKEELIRITGDTTLANLFLDKTYPKMDIVPKVISHSDEVAKKIKLKQINPNASQIMGAVGFNAFGQTTFFRFYVRLIEAIKNRNKPYVDKLLELEKVIAYKITQGELYQDEIREIVDILSISANKGGVSPTSIESEFKSWIIENSIVTWDKKVLDEVLVSSPEFKFMYENASKDLAKFERDIIGLRVQALFGIISKNRVRPDEKYMYTLLRRTWEKISTGSSVLPEEAQVVISKIGVNNYIKGRAWSMLVIHFVLLPAFWSFIDGAVTSFRIGKMNDQIDQLKRMLCPGFSDTPILSKEECDQYFKLVDISDSTSFIDGLLKNEAWIVQVFTKAFWTGESHNYLPGTEIEKYIHFMVSVAASAFNPEKNVGGDLSFRWFADYFFTNIKNSELGSLAFDPELDVKQNYINLKKKIYEVKFSDKPGVYEWIYKQANSTEWDAFKPSDYENNKNKYEIKYIDNDTGEESPNLTQNTTIVYRKLQAGESFVGKVWDKAAKTKIRLKFNCLFKENEITRQSLYNKDYEDDGYFWTKDSEGELAFKIQRNDESKTIDQINFVEYEGDGIWMRYGDSEEFDGGCKRAEVLVLGWTQPYNGDALSIVQAKKIGIPVGFYKKLENNNFKLNYIDDNNVSFVMDDGITQNLKKYEEGGKWYWFSKIENGEEIKYEEKENPIRENYEKKQKIKTLNESIREKLTSKYIDKTKKMKTLNESIREKLTSKYVNKTNKFLKINENYEKVYKHFEKGDYDTYFKKMFKLAEAFKNSKLYLTEADDELFSKGISLLGGQEPMIKEKFVDFLSKDLGLTPSMRDYIESKIEETPNTQIGDLFMKPSVVIDIIVDAVVENVKSSSSEPTDLMSAIELTTVPYFDSPEFRYKLSKVLKPMIGQKLENKKGKIIDMVKRALKAKEEKSKS